MFEQKNRYPIAVDLGENGLCAVQLKNARGGLSIRGVFQQRIDAPDETPEGSSASLASVLKGLSKSGSFRGGRAVMHLPQNHTYSFPIQFQTGKDETVEAAIVRECKEYLPFPLEQATIDYPSIRKIGPEESRRYKATVIATRTDDIRRFFAAFGKAGLSLEAVDSAVASLYRLHDHIFSVPDKPVVLCHVGKTQSLVAVVRKDGMLGERTVPWGIDGLIRKIQDSMELEGDSVKAKTLLKNYGLRYEARQAERIGAADASPEAVSHTLYQIIAPYMEDLVDELHRLIGYIRSEEAKTVFEGLWVYGLGFLLGHLDGFIANRVDMPATVVDLMDHFAVDNGGILPDLTECTALSLTVGLGMRKVSWL